MSYGLGSIQVAGAPLVLPGYIGAMIVGIALRSSLELTGRPWIRDRVVALLMFVCLDLFLAIAVMSVDLVQLAHVAIPMLVILTAQVAFMVIFAATVTFRTMGSDYNAAVLAAGHCGFGLGASPNAVANMESLVKRHGPAPEAFLVLPIAAGFLLDFTNAAVISLSIRSIAPESKTASLLAVGSRRLGAEVWYCRRQPARRPSPNLQPTPSSRARARSVVPRTGPWRRGSLVEPAGPSATLGPVSSEAIACLRENLSQISSLVDRRNQKSKALMGSFRRARSAPRGDCRARRRADVLDSRTCCRCCCPMGCGRS